MAANSNHGGCLATLTASVHIEESLGRLTVLMHSPLLESTTARTLNQQAGLPKTKTNPLPWTCSNRPENGHMRPIQTTIASAKRRQSSPGQFKPTPSPTQKVPNADNNTPTQNFSVFSGIAVSGMCMTSPSRTTQSNATSAPKTCFFMIL
jgi:hypothetical protein